MSLSELKDAANLISLVANAVATNTIEEAIDFLEESTIYNKALKEHSVAVLISILTKQNEDEKKEFMEQAFSE